MAAELGGGEFWARFVIAALATWRVAHLLAYEDGPGDLIAKLRAKLGYSFFGKLMDCFYCLSVWVAAPFAPTVTLRLLDAVLIWLALSGAACLLERATATPVQVHPAPPNSSDNEGE